MGLYRSIQDFFTKTTLQHYKGKKIIMLHHGRCGSTVLTNMFHEYSLVDWQGEAFKDSRRKGIERSTRGLLDGVMKYPARKYTKYFGFEIKPMHLEDFSVSMDEFVGFCAHQKFDYYITLTRKNLLRKVISSDIGKMTRKWHLKPGDTLQKQTVTLSVDEKCKEYIVSRLASLESEVSEIKNIKTPALHLTYEDDIKDNPSVGFKKLQDFLGLPKKDISPSLRRANPESVSDLVTNFEMVERQLAGTPYQWMLYD